VSCFIVGKETVQVVVSHLIATDQLDGMDPHDMVEALYALNASAYAARYGDTPAAGHPYGKLKWSTPRVYDAQKALHVFLYQCHEGRIPEMSALYKRLRAICDGLDAEIGNTTHHRATIGWGD
jgi:hypothetical protein